MANIKDKIEKYNKLTKNKSIISTDIQRIKAFKNRKPGNKDTADAVTDGMILVKFAGTGCYLPIEIFDGHLEAREVELEEQLLEIESEIEKL